MLGSPSRMRTALFLVPARAIVATRTALAATILEGRDINRLSNMILPPGLLAYFSLPLHFPNCGGIRGIGRCGGGSFFVFLGVTHELDDGIEAFRPTAHDQPCNPRVNSGIDLGAHNVEHMKVSCISEGETGYQRDQPNDH